MNNRRRFIGETILLNLYGKEVRATIVDIQFDDGLGPLFLMINPVGHTFWQTRRELKENEVQ